MNSHSSTRRGRLRSHRTIPCRPSLAHQQLKRPRRLSGKSDSNRVTKCFAWVGLVLILERILPIQPESAVVRVE